MLAYEEIQEILDELRTAVVDACMTFIATEDEEVFDALNELQDKLADKLYSGASDDV